MTTLLEYLNQVPLAGFMLTVALGFWLGRVQWRGISLGPAGGTLLVALLLGAWGLSFRDLYGSDNPPVTLGLFGFCLFIYSVGFEAGPRFFSALRGGSGWKIALVATVVNVVALLLALLIGRFFDLGGAMTAGMLSGALTSAPTYAAAAEASRDLAPLAVSFAITYPFGLVGVVFMVQCMPRFMRDDLAADIDDVDDVEDCATPVLSAKLVRVFDVQHDGVIGRTLADLDLTHATGCTITRVHRGDRTTLPDAETVLNRNDHVMVRGRLDELQAFERLVGPEVYDEELRERLATPRAIRVASGAVIGRPLSELDLIRRFHSIIVRVERRDIGLDPDADLTLERDDIAMVSGPRREVRQVADLLGRFEQSSQETDIAVYAGGILLGLLLGNLHWKFGSLDFRLGIATGLLLVGVLLGRFRRIGPITTHVPAAARQLVRDLGILLLIAETGVKAGNSSWTGVPLLAVGGGAAITAITVVVSVLFGRFVLKMRPVQVWGSVCGGLTSSAALTAIRGAADSNEPAIPYATAYAVASVLATLAGQAVVLLM